MTTVDELLNTWDTQVPSEGDPITSFRELLRSAAVGPFAILITQLKNSHHKSTAEFFKTECRARQALVLGLEGTPTWELPPSVQDITIKESAGIKKRYGGSLFTMAVAMIPTARSAGQPVLWPDPITLSSAPEDHKVGREYYVWAHPTRRVVIVGDEETVIRESESFGLPFRLKETFKKGVETLSGAFISGSGEENNRDRVTQT